MCHEQGRAVSVSVTVFLFEMPVLALVVSFSVASSKDASSSMATVSFVVSSSA